MTAKSDDGYRFCMKCGLPLIEKDVVDREFNPKTGNLFIFKERVCPKRKSFLGFVNGHDLLVFSERNGLGWFSLSIIGGGV